MLYRKIESVIAEHFKSKSDKIMILTGARQVGKSYIIRHAGKRLFRNFVEINLVDDANGPKIFESVKSTEEFYLVLSSIAGDRLHDKDDTLIFLDEIQKYPHMLTMLKFLREEGRYTYVASGSLLGVTLRQSVSIPVGSVEIRHMYPLDFEEFMIANGVGHDAIEALAAGFYNLQTVAKGLHDRVMDLFRRYLLVGGLPDAVNAYIATHNIMNVRRIQSDIHNLYGEDAAQYDSEHKLKIKRIYELVPSTMESRKKRLVFKDIEGKAGARGSQFAEEIDYLASSGITLEVNAISNPRFPLLESVKKNLLKLYLNDVGLLTMALYRNNIRPILDDDAGVNLGAVYETVAAMELTAHGNAPRYYDNKTYGEVDFLIDDYDTLSVTPIEIKSGKDYNVHSALSRFVATPDYGIKRACVLCNSPEIKEEGGIIYMPIYNLMFFSPNRVDENSLIF